MKKAAESAYHKQLSRIYIAYRELMARPFADNELLPLRNELLGYWGKAAAWYGLHGHIRSGVLAATESMARVRERLRENTNVNIAGERLEFPGGQLASALYSISKHLRGSRRWEVLDTALEYLGRSLRENSSNEANLLAIRGSIFRIQGQVANAVADYESVVRLRERNGASCSAIGEGLSELGFGYLRQWRLRKGRDYLEEGVRLLREAGPSGFLARALRKLAVAYMVTGHPIKARSTLEEARRMAREGKMFDQLR